MTRISLMRWWDRCERAVWLAFLFALPFQTRIILWKADPVFIEWRSITLFVSDVLLLVVLGSVVARYVAGWRPKGALRSWDIALGVLFLAAFVSVFRAPLGPVAWTALARLLEGIALYGYVRWYVAGRFDADVSLAAFLVGAFTQACLGIGQFLVQHDLGFRLLGETLLRPTMRGVAVFFDLAGEKTLRAYGTLPHPNVLAALLSSAWFVTGYLAVRHIGATVRRAWLVWAVIGTVLVWGLLATFSRTVLASIIGAGAVLSVVIGTDRWSGSWPNIAMIRSRARSLVFGAFLAAAIFAVIFWPQVLARVGISPGEEAVQLRVFYNEVALGSGTGPLGINWFGSGVGNFVSWLRDANPHLPAWQYQPAHNLYLLVYTETGLFGLLGLIAFAVLLFRTLVRSRRTEPLLIWGMAVLLVLMSFISLFDHFTWTLQQGRLLWWLLWGAAAALATRSDS